MSNTPHSARSKIVRSAKRAHYDKDSLYEVLDEGFICHVAYEYEGSPVIIPTAYCRSGDTVYVHGAVKNRMLNSIVSQKMATVSVTHLDGMVLARSAFHHSFNYRSAVVFGKPFIVEDAEEKTQILKLITENILKGRWDEVRTPNEKELAITLVVGINIEEFSVKIRSGKPIDDEEDYALPIWSGELPLQLQYQEPITDDSGVPDLDIPVSVQQKLKKK
jgi:nitroimidazol reductase NimA-like FMN-containing flavoprotein (pyridoxamine 5'-phosphate oxidase superfamily)